MLAPRNLELPYSVGMELMQANGCLCLADKSFLIASFIVEERDPRFLNRIIFFFVFLPLLFSCVSNYLFLFSNLYVSLLLLFVEII